MKALRERLRSGGAETSPCRRRQPRSGPVRQYRVPQPAAARWSGAARGPAPRCQPPDQRLHVRQPATHGHYGGTQHVQHHCQRPRHQIRPQIHQPVGPRAADAAAKAHAKRMVPDPNPLPRLGQGKALGSFSTRIGRPSRARNRVARSMPSMQGMLATAPAPVTGSTIPAIEMAMPSSDGRRNPARQLTNAARSSTGVGASPDAVTRPSIARPALTCDPPIRNPGSCRPPLAPPSGRALQVSPGRCSLGRPLA